MNTDALLGLPEVMDLMLDAVCVVDREGRFLFVNAAFERIFGYQPQEVLGRPMLELVYPEDQEKTLHTVDTLLAGELRPNFENRWVHKSGYPVDVLWSARWSEEHQVRIAVAHDISERKQMEARLYHQAGHDSLTDLPNRALLLDRLQIALKRAQRDRTQFSLLFIDMDGFKAVNDNYGHLVGDNLLRRIALRLKEFVRASDTVGRLGGDEFLVLLNGTGELHDVVMIAEKIRAELEQPYEVDGNELCLAPSIGIAQYPEDGEDEQMLIQRADKAMYQAKSTGGNRVAFIEPASVDM